MVLHEALHNVCEYARFLVFVELLVIKTQCTVVPSVIPSPIWVLMVAQVSMVGKGRALDQGSRKLHYAEVGHTPK